MNIYVADTNEKTRALLHQSFDAPIQDYPEFRETPVLKIAYKIIAGASTLDLILINAEATFHHSKRQQFKGIELLTWLRVRYWGQKNKKNKRFYLRCPIVIYGFLSVDQVLKIHPEHFIILAPGNLHVQLPFSKQKLSRIIDKVCQQKDIQHVTEEGYKHAYLPYLKPAFSIDRFRHQQANWWGVKCLHEIHKIVISRTRETFPYHSNVTNNLNKIENGIANFLFSANEKEIRSAVDARLGEVKMLRDAIVTRKDKPSIFYIDDKANDGWTDILLQIIYESATLEEYNDVLDIYYVNGVPKFYCVKNIDKYNIADFTNLLLDAIEQKRIVVDLILLDLRLRDDEENHEKIKELSGYILLEQFRSVQKGIPVVITSASNKIWNYEELIKTGADAYWMKEGIDEQKSAEDSVENYIALLSLINNLTRKEYRVFKDFGNAVQYFRTKDCWWKKEIDWSEIGSGHNMRKLKISDKTVPNVDAIVSILDDCFVLFREFLQRKILKNHYDPFTEKDWVLPSLIVQHGSKIIELIHDFENHEKIHQVVKWLNKGLINGFTCKPNEISNKWYGQLLYQKRILYFPIRCDEKGKKIYEQRNMVSHTSELHKINFSILEQFIANLIDYLETAPLKDAKKYTPLTKK